MPSRRAGRGSQVGTTCSALTFDRTRRNARGRSHSRRLEASRVVLDKGQRRATPKLPALPRLPGADSHKKLLGETRR